MKFLSCLSHSLSKHDSSILYSVFSLIPLIEMSIEMYVGQLLNSIFNGFVDCYVKNLNVVDAARGYEGWGDI